MIERAGERARGAGAGNRIQYCVAGAQDLPFEDDLFDAVITESVTALVEEKQRAVNEYARVARPGGWIGLNESTWLETPPPPEVVAWVSRAAEESGTPVAADEWERLLVRAGLKDVISEVRHIEVGDETRNLLQRYGWAGMMRVFWRILGLYFRNPSYRDFVKRIRQDGVLPERLNENFGYGLYVGRA